MKELIIGLIVIIIDSLLSAHQFKEAVNAWKNNDIFECGFCLSASIVFTAAAAYKFITVVL